jgi:hypothetical protein
MSTGHMTVPCRGTVQVKVRLEIPPDGSVTLPKLSFPMPEKAIAKLEDLGMPMTLVVTF